MAFLVGGVLRLKQGTVQFGADTNLYRSAANTLRTNDAFTVDGAFTASGAASLAGSVNISGTAVLPYGTDGFTITANGQVAFVHKGNRCYLQYRSGGTPCYITLPQVSEGTMLVTVGGTP